MRFLFPGLLKKINLTNLGDNVIKNFRKFCINNKKKILLVAFGTGGIFTYLFKNYYQNHNEFHFHEDNLIKDKLDLHIEEFQKRYYNTIYMFSSFVAIAYGVILDDLDLKYEREILINDEGENFALDWVPFESIKNEKGNLSKKTSTPIVILIPGITGDSEETYMK